MSWHTNSNALPLSLSTFKKDDYDNSTNEKFLFPLIEKLKKDFELSTYVQYPKQNDQNVGHVLFNFNVLPHMTTDIFYRNGKYFVNFKFWSFDGRIPLIIYGYDYGYKEFPHAKSFSLGYMLNEFVEYFCDGTDSGFYDTDCGYDTIDETVKLISLFVNDLTTALTDGAAVYDYGR